MKAGYRPKIKTIFAVNHSIGNGINKCNALPSTKFHLWWCQVYGHGSFESKRTADDYAFGMLLNGYPAVVMEVPKAIIINNTKIRES